MTEQEYNQLEDLNQVMYTLDYVMGDRKDLIDFKNQLDSLTKTVYKLILMPTKEFSETIKEFDKKHLGDLYEEEAI